MLAELDNLSWTQGYSFQLYGLGYLLSLDKEIFYDIETNIIDIILDNMIAGPDNHTFICEDGLIENYFVSHHYNFSLNLLIYIGLKSFIKRNSYRISTLKSLLKNLEIFLMYEKDFIDLSGNKTIGFELVVGKYIDQVKGFTDNIFSDRCKELRNKRLKNFSKLLLFTPEGLNEKDMPSNIRNIVISALKINTKSQYLFNSPESTLFFIDNVRELRPHIVDIIKKDIIEHKGFPAFYYGEYYDIFWIIDILNSAKLINSKMKKKLRAIVSTLNMFDSESIGTFDPEKGLAISSKFSMYDLDTTAVAIKSLLEIGLYTSIASDFDFSYYKNKANGLYYTFKSDNRTSASVLAHVLSAQVSLGKYDKKILDYLINLINHKFYDDKFHSSIVYTMYTLIISFVDISKVTEDTNKTLQIVLADLLELELESGGFNSKNQQNINVEETAWAIIAIKYYIRFFAERRDEMLLIINRAQKKIEKVFIGFHLLPKQWIVKQIYTPVNINKILIEAALQPCL